MSGQVERPVLNIEGELVALGPLCREHLPLYVQWINNFQTAGNLAIQPGPMTLEQEAAWYEQAAQSDNQRNFAIYERATDALSGTAACRPSTCSTGAPMWGS